MGNTGVLNRAAICSTDGYLLGKLPKSLVKYSVKGCMCIVFMYHFAYSSFVHIPDFATLESSLHFMASEEVTSYLAPRLSTKYLSAMSFTHSLYISI
jgi:hypothetical protein